MDNETAPLWAAVVALMMLLGMNYLNDSMSTKWARQDVSWLQDQYWDLLRASLKCTAPK